MALLDLKTDLKSLKYGSDTPGGGNSGQPYQQVDINKVDSGFNRFRMTKFDDGLVRGGVVGAANASIVDTFRIGKFLKDFPKGPLFIVKQVGLQLSNPRLESKQLNTSSPTSGQGFLRNVGNLIANTANKIVNAVGPTRIYNLGINTLAQVPVNAFGQLFIRHVLLPFQDDQTKYLAVAQFNNEEKGSPNNRLVGLKTRFRLGDSQTENIPGFNNKKQRKLLAQAINDIVFGGVIKKPKPIGFLDANKELTVDRYIGGPGSVYGIGNTTIPRKTFTEDKSKIDLALEQSKTWAGKSHLDQDPTEAKIKDTIDFGISLLTTSKLTDSSFNLIKDTDLNINSSLLDYNAITTYSSSLSLAGTNQKNSFISASRNIRNFVQASLRSGSIFGKEDFNEGFSLYSNPKNNPRTLVDKTPNTYSGSTTWTPQNGESNETFGLPALVRKVNKYADLGLTILTTGDRGDLDVTDFTTKGETTITYTPSAIATGNAAKYAELRKKVDAGTSIDQTYITEITKQGSKTETFKTFNVNISRNDPGLIYNRLTKLAFRRTNDTDINDDNLALQFIPLDPFTGNGLRTLKFLGYITDYTEDYKSTWNNIKYAGRNENFYIFNEFQRTVNVGFNIPCFNPDELEQKHCDMSELASVLAGKYQDNLLLGGIITRLKVGRYINDQPGIINNLSFSPIEGSSWDLDRGLAFYLKVSFGFTLIHNFLPQYGKCGFIDRQPDPIPETVPEETDTTPEEDDRRNTTTITIEDIPPTRIDNTRNANLEATRQRAEFEKDKYVPPTKAQNDAARKLLNSLPSSN